MDQQIPNIINVVNHNDGLASASLNTVTKFFEQIKAVDDLQLQRREMFKMLMEKVPTQGKKAPPWSEITLTTALLFSRILASK